MAHGDAREGTSRGNWRMEFVASTLHTTSEHGVSSITTADAHTPGCSSRRNWRPPADLKGLVRFAERRNLVSARVPSHFNWPLPPLFPEGKATGAWGWSYNAPPHIAPKFKKEYNYNTTSLCGASRSVPGWTFTFVWHLEGPIFLRQRNETKRNYNLQNMKDKRRFWVKIAAVKSKYQYPLSARDLMASILPVTAHISWNN